MSRIIHNIFTSTEKNKYVIKIIIYKNKYKLRFINVEKSFKNMIQKFVIQNKKKLSFKIIIIIYLNLI